MLSWLELTAILNRPIAFHRVFADIGGGAIPGLFLSQAFYWTGKTKDPNGWFYKTQEEWQKETALIRSEQDRARRELKSRRLIEEKKEGLPCKLYYRVNKAVLLESISILVEENQRNSQFGDFSNQFGKSSKLETSNEQTALVVSANTAVKTSKQSIYRDYSEITSETTSEIAEGFSNSNPEKDPEPDLSSSLANSTNQNEETNVSGVDQKEAACDNNTKRPLRKPEGDKFFGRVMQENRQRSLAAKLNQGSVIPIAEAGPWESPEEFEEFEEFLLSQSTWHDNPASFVATKLKKISTKDLPPTEFKAWKKAKQSAADATTPRQPTQEEEAAHAKFLAEMRSPDFHAHLKRPQQQNLEQPNEKRHSRKLSNLLGLSAPSELGRRGSDS